MNEKLQTFGKSLYSNNELLKLSKMPLLLLALMLFVNVSLVSSPNFIGYMDGLSVTERLDGVDTAFEEMYATELDCAVNEEAVIQCDGDFQETYGDYQFQYQDTLDTDNIEESTILFTPEKAAIIYQGDTTEVLDGNYSLLAGFDFSNMKANAQSSDTEPETYYENNTDFFLKNLYYSDLNQHIGLVYSVQFAQTILYVVLVSLMVLMVNFRVSVKKITYQAALRVTILAMTGPALLAALLGLWIPGWAYLIFTMLYLIRIIVIYYGLNRRNETLVGPKETPETREEIE